MAIAFTAGQLVTANQMNLLAPLLAVKSSPRTVTFARMSEILRFKT